MAEVLLESLSHAASHLTPPLKGQRPTKNGNTCLHIRTQEAEAGRPS